MPRCFSSSIQSEAVARWFLRAVTAPARWMALPYSRNFSVSVVLPASGCEMIANVRRRAISAEGGINGSGGGWVVAGKAVEQPGGEAEWKAEKLHRPAEPAPPTCHLIG